MNQVQAKVGFYHDLTGSRAQGEVFNVDAETLRCLEDAGYVQKVDSANLASVDANAAIRAEIESKQHEYGQAQAHANERASLMAHEQNVQANQMTQQFSQEAAKRAESKGANYTNQADKKYMEAQAGIHNPTANPNASAKTTARKADK